MLGIGLALLLQATTVEAVAETRTMWLGLVDRDGQRPSQERTAADRTAGGGPGERAPAGQGAGMRMPSGDRGADMRMPSGDRAARGGSGGEGGGARSHGERMQKALIYEGVFPQANARPAGAGPLDARFWLERPDHRLVPLTVRQEGPRRRVEFPTGTGGDYRLIGYDGDRVAGGSRLHLYAYYGFMMHGEVPGKVQRDTAYRPGFLGGTPRLEIVRFFDNDGDRYRSRVGHTARVQVLFEGKPLANAPISLTTSQDWQRRLQTDADGKAEFTLIKEEFRDGPIDKNRTALFLLQTEHVEDSPGNYFGNPYERERFVATLAFQVFPDSNEWESKRVAYLIFVFTTLVGGAAIVTQRLRRRTRA
ncbi:MAG TPA: hypothetical protein PLJ34_00705 [Hyphomicrobiales bacterium]|nr:hypothetical protein [Hyphomicrobiales bacterium]